MKIDRLRINHVVLRYDDVPNGVSSELFHHTIVPSRGNVLSSDFFWCRGIAPELFEQFIAGTMIPRFKDEICRMRRLGLRPVLHVDYVNRGNEVFWLSLNSSTVQGLGKAGSGIDICVRKNGKEYVAGLTATSLHHLSRFKFSIELA